MTDQSDIQIAVRDAIQAKNEELTILTQLLIECRRTQNLSDELAEKIDRVLGQ